MNQHREKRDRTKQGTQSDEKQEATDQERLTGTAVSKEEVAGVEMKLDCTKIENLLFPLNIHLKIETINHWFKKLKAILEAFPSSLG